MTLADIPEGERADYCFRNHGVIVEQKECLADRRQELAEYHREAWELAEKYGFDRRQLFEAAAIGDASAVAANVARWTPDERRRVINLSSRALRFVEDDLKKADGQIASTKRLLGRDDLGGLVLLINEGAGYFIPQLLTVRATTLLNQQSDGRSRFAHIDAVLLFQKLQGFTISGGSGMTTIVGKKGPEGPVFDFAKAVAGAFGPHQRVGRELMQFPEGLPDHMRPSTGSLTVNFLGVIY